MNNELMFSSVSQSWATRWEVFDQIAALQPIPFTLDPCCEIETRKCERFFTKENDMFSIKSWTNGELFDNEENAFVNPEYGREQPKFVKEVVKRFKEGQLARASVLIPARTDTKLFHEVILPNASTIYLYNGRLVFGTDDYWEDVWETEFVPNGKGGVKENPLYKKYGKFQSAPFPSMVVEFSRERFNSTPTIKTLKAPKFKYLGDKSA